MNRVMILDLRKKGVKLTRLAVICLYDTIEPMHDPVYNERTALSPRRNTVVTKFVPKKSNRNGPKKSRRVQPRETDLREEVELDVSPEERRAVLHACREADATYENPEYLGGPPPKEPREEWDTEPVGTDEIEMPPEEREKLLRGHDVSSRMHHDSGNMGGRRKPRARD